MKKYKGVNTGNEDSLFRIFLFLLFDLFPEHQFFNATLSMFYFIKILFSVLLLTLNVNTLDLTEYIRIYTLTLLRHIELPLNQSKM